MDNQQIKTSQGLDIEYSEKCDIFENTLTEEQQEKFYKLETLISSLTSDQKKMFFRLMKVSSQMNNIINT